MTLSFYYISNGKMYRFKDGSVKELHPEVLESYIRKVKDSAERNEWKYSGSGAAFTGGYRHGASAEASVNSIYSHVNCMGEHNGKLIYSIDIDNTNGIYRAEDGANDGIVLCSSTTAYREFDIRGNLLATTTAFAGESHIGVLNLAGKAFTTYTEGRVRESWPAWSASEAGKVYFCSAGLPEGEEKEKKDEENVPRSINQMVNDMYSSAKRAEVGPSSICIIDVIGGELHELLSDDRYDFTRPQSTSDGSLYYVRKPYKQQSGSAGGFGCLLDAILLPARLIGALFGFLNVFTAKYSGKTLSRSNVKSRDEKQLLIDGNLINAEKELRENQRRGDKNPGIIPASWELRRLDRSGNDVLVRKGVNAFRVNDETGDILISNGSAILRIDKNGREEKLLSAEGVSFIR